MPNKVIIPAVLLILVVAVGYWVTQPKNYDDCLLKYINEAQTDLAVRAIAESCENKFKKK